MRFLIWAIGIGLLAGAALFFIPFVFPFFFFILFFFLLSRLFFWRSWGRWRYGYGPGWPTQGKNFPQDILPIDGQYPGQVPVSREGERRIKID
jgi:uncharacterized membrane protein YphA (DoxX/SURF4 family)